MKRILFALGGFLLAGLFACGDDAKDPELPAKVVSFGDYQFTCVDATTKNPVLDTLRFEAVGGTYSSDISLRRERIEDGVATGVYEYINPTEFLMESSMGFTPQLEFSNAEHAVTLIYKVPENRDPDNAILGSVVISASGNRLTLPVKQQAAVFSLIGEPAIYHTGQADKVIYLDHKGATTNFEAALATPYAINGTQVEDRLWTKEEAEFSYSLSDDTYIKVVGVSSEIPGVYVLCIETVPSSDTHNAVLTLKFVWEGQTYTKQVNLQSTEVFHVDFN